MEHVLIATLGDSPIVVTSMYDKLNAVLIEQKKQPIDRVIIIHPRGGNREVGYLVIDETLPHECKVESCELDCADIYTEEDCFHFLRTLFDVFKKHQHDTISLSLAGGRKNMSALMALVAPFYPQCLQGLYHILDASEDTDQRNIRSIDELENFYENDKSRLQKVMHPPLEDLKLVRVPFENALHVKEAYAQKLLSMTAEQLQGRWAKEPEETEKDLFYLPFANPDISKSLLQVYLTEQAKEDFEVFGDNVMREFTTDFKNMRFPSILAQKSEGKKVRDPKRRKPYPCYLYKRGGHTAERPFFHTEPGDILHYLQTEVKCVIIERLARHINEKDVEPNEEQLLRTTYDPKKLYTLEEVLKKTHTKRLATQQPTPSILIVPMGTTPMVATQLYTLLKMREKRAIQEVILLHTEYESVRQAAQIAKDAFDYEKVTCTMKLIPGLVDIASEEDCQTYQNELEKIIIGLQQTKFQQHLDWRIDLALSGGRKGMAALALFAAQRTQLSEVYHTLITDETLNRRIEAATKSNALKGKRQKEVNALLFLEAYKDHEDDFQLFKVPMGPLHGK